MPEPGRALPQPTPETQHFWDGTRAGELRLQRCDGCSNVYFPPRPFCPACASRSVSVFKATGKAILDYRGAIDLEGALLRALPEQLGLALKPVRAPYPVLVVDHVEKVPTAN